MEPRALGEGDLDDMCALEDEADHHRWSRGQLADELESGVGLGLFEGAALVGHAYFRAQANEWWLMQVRVRSDARRRGHARALLEAGLARAPEACDEAWLEVAEDNAGAIALYAALGFEERGRRPRYYPDGRAAVLLARALRPSASGP
jgi:ribosomal-protein-alanine N-acetyltransferase